MPVVREVGVVPKGQQRDPCGDGNVLYLYRINYSFTRCYHWEKPQTSLYYFLTVRESTIILNKKFNKKYFNSPVLNHSLLAVPLSLSITFMYQMGVDVTWSTEEVVKMMRSGLFWGIFCR